MMSKQSRNLFRLGLLVGLAGLAGTISCSRSWEVQKEVLAAVWIDSNRFAVPHLSYERRKSWNPFSSDEQRRKYQTEIVFREKQGAVAAPAAGLQQILSGGILISGPVSAFGGMLYVRRLPEGKAWMHELVFQPPGAEERVLVRSGQRGATIRGLLQSPDGKKVLLVYNVNSEDFVLIMLDHIPAPEDPAPRPEKVTVGGTPEIAWDAGSAYVTIRGSKEILQWDGRRVPKAVDRGPACFYPPTRTGLTVSDQGLEARLSDPANPESWSFLERADWKAHAAIPIVTGTEVGKGCPKGD